ncbi:unnamed protein product [Paramecium pentaurelia]|uniref:Carboxypeptidase n=1 Tax=Paramecium pentaurelia TaxID=43138 RepID=A0A8S1TZF6_9CILI|nr:unnamed protein product [Paramecium pentaurelia]
MWNIILFATITIVNGYLSFKEDPYDYTNVFPSIGELPNGTKCTKVDAQKLNPLFDQNQIIFSGYLSVIENSKSCLGFIFYGSEKATQVEDLSKYPTLIWLNGGPGSSSQLGNFMELGPLIMQENGTFRKNIYAWNKEYNVIFVDQPIGAGLAYPEKQSDVPTNQKQIGQQFLFALQQFLQSPEGCVKKNAIPGLQKSTWFIFGESYAGKYVPTIAKAILDYNMNAVDQIPLKGIGIGDPFTDPYSVIAEYASYSFNLGLIDVQERAQIDSILVYGLNELNKGNSLNARAAFDKSLDLIGQYDGGMNVYNVLQYGSYNNAKINIQNYLREPLILNQLGLSADWVYKISNGADGPVQKALSYDFMLRDVVQTVEEILPKIPMFVFSGQNDLICSTPGTLRWLYNLKYSKIDEYKKKDFEIVKLLDTEKIVGYYKQAGNLELQLVNNAGHMIPTDQPQAALEMIMTFVNKHKN